MKELRFSYNWNKKLDCKSFSTVRIANLTKYVLLDEYEVVLTTKGTSPDISKGIAILQHISYFNLYKVSPAISYLDANLSVFEFQKLVLKMYSKSNVDFRTAKLAFMVFQYIPIVNKEAQLALSEEFQK